MKLLDNHNLDTSISSRWVKKSDNDFAIQGYWNNLDVVDGSVRIQIQVSLDTNDTDLVSTISEIFLEEASGDFIFHAATNVYGSYRINIVGGGSDGHISIYGT